MLVASETFARDKWPMGIIEDVEVDADGLVRTAVVRTSERKQRRDVRKICLLEGAD